MEANILLILYVDDSLHASNDILHASNDMNLLKETKTFVAKNFEMKLGEASFVIGIKIFQDWYKRLFNLSQNY